MSERKKSDSPHEPMEDSSSETSASFWKSPLDSEENMKEEVKRVLRLLNDQSASLILMVLCDDSLDLHQLEEQSDNDMFESKLKAVKSLITSVSRTDIAKASRYMRGVFFTEGEIISFTHPTLFDVCTQALYNMNPSFFLENCSLECLFERVRLSPEGCTDLKDQNRLIYVTEVFYDILVQRLTDAIENGDYSLTITHPILQKGVVVDKLLRNLKLIEKKEATTRKFLYKTYGGKYLLQWIIKGQSLYLLKEIDALGPIFSDRELVKGLYMASSCGNVEAMEHLFENYESDFSDNNMRTALKIAADKCRTQIVVVLLQHGALLSDLSFEKQQSLFHVAAGEENTRICGAILQHILQNRRLADTVWMILVQDPAITFRKFCDEVLNIASVSGHLRLAEFVIRYADVNVRGEQGRTPTMNAAVRGREALFDLLVSNGADITLVDDAGDSPLHLACWEGHTSFVEHILPLFDINSRGDSGWTPVMYAAASGEETLFRLLVSKGADLKLTDTAGDYVFHKACEGGSLPIVKQVLPLFDINQRGGNGHTPLMKTVCRGHSHVFDLLLSHKADTTLVDDDCDTLLHLASEVGDLEMVERCLPLSDINCKDKHGWTPLMASLVFGERDVAEFLLMEGSDTTLLDEVGDDVVTLAYRGGCPSVVEHLDTSHDETKKTESWTSDMTYLVCGYSEPLLNYKHDDPRLTEKDGFGDTLLHLACRGGKIRYVEHLLPCYDINVRGRYGWTPVMMAARCGCYDVFMCLLSHHADLSLVSDRGEDVLVLAQQGGNGDILTHLMSHPEFKNRF